MEKDLKEKIDKLFEEKLDALIEKKIIEKRSNLYDLEFLTIEKLEKLSKELNICFYDLMCYYCELYNTESCNELCSKEALD